MMARKKHTNSGNVMAEAFCIAGLQYLRVLYFKTEIICLRFSIHRCSLLICLGVILMRWQFSRSLARAHNENTGNGFNGIWFCYLLNAILCLHKRMDPLMSQELGCVLFAHFNALMSPYYSRWMFFFLCLLEKRAKNAGFLQEKKSSHS